MTISIPKKVINLYISYALPSQLKNLNTTFTLRNRLFVPVKLTKNAHVDTYKYAGFGIEFDSRSEFYLQMEAMEIMSSFLELI